MSMPVKTLSPASKSSAPQPPLILKNTREASFSSYSEDDKEIDVFDAHKYFNDALNCSPPPHHHKKDDLAIKKPLSISSESSWNSRRALLRRNQQLKKPKKKSFLATIGCNCTCADSNSVDIDDDVGRFSFPVLKEDARSPRVISSPVNKKLTMVTWDAIAPSEEQVKIPCISSDSDASSDLFEIESLYKDNPNRMTPSAADFSPLSSPSKVSKTLHLKILSGCKTHKAVSVTPLTRFHTSQPRSATAAHLLYTL